METPALHRAFARLAHAPRERAAPSPRALEIEWLGTLEYRDALALQEEAVARRRAGIGGDRLLLLEHPAVITLGRSADGSNLRASRAALAARGVEVVSVARGGDVTWHGPGQLVGYPIVDLAARGAPDVHRFLRGMETALIEALAELGVAAQARPGATGVFVAGGDPPRKIASIGIGLRGFVTWHGFALNVSCGPEAFADIVPCGLHGVEMTSVARERGAAGEGELGPAARAAVGAAFLRWLA